MFEIYGRHKPMFTLSNVRQMAGMLSRFLDIDRLEVDKDDIVILPIFQTARINEFNRFIIKSKLDPSAVRRVIECNSIANGLLETDKVNEVVLKKLMEDVTDIFGVNGIIHIDGVIRNVEYIAAPIERPLIVFSTESPMPCVSYARPEWYGLDIPAVWVGNGWESRMDGVEAYFALCLGIKQEIDLNRYNDLHTYSNVAVGMIRF